MIDRDKQKYSPIIEKEILERASFLCILLHDQKGALSYQQKICSLNQTLYIDNLEDLRVDKERAPKTNDPFDGGWEA